MRAIDADKLKDVLEKNFGHTGGASVLAQLIDAQDTIQPEIVRCKDCKHYDEIVHCDRVSWWNGKDDYCSRAERREVTT